MAGRPLSNQKVECTSDSSEENEVICMEQENRDRGRRSVNVIRRNTKTTKANDDDAKNHLVLQESGIDTSGMSRNEIQELAQVILMSKAETTMSAIQSKTVEGSDEDEYMEVNDQATETDKQEEKVNDESQKPGTSKQGVIAEQDIIQKDAAFIIDKETRATVASDTQNSVEKNTRNDKGDESDEETQYEITEPTLKEDFIAEAQSNGNRFGMKRLTQVKMDRFSHVIIPESPPPRSPSPENFSDLSPIKRRKPIRHSVLETDDEETLLESQNICQKEKIEHSDIRKDLQNAQVDSQETQIDSQLTELIHCDTKQASSPSGKKFNVDSGEKSKDVYDIDGEDSGDKTPPPREGMRKLKEVLRHPVQFLLNPEDEVLENTPSKPLDRQYRKGTIQTEAAKIFISKSLENMNEYTSVILQYFRLYHEKVTRLQCQSKCMLSWGESVKAGKHWERTIDAKRRGQDSYDFDDTDNEMEVILLNDQINTNVPKAAMKTDDENKEKNVVTDDEDFEKYVPIRKTRSARNATRGLKEGDKCVSGFVSGEEKSLRRTEKRRISLSDSDDEVLICNKSKKVSGNIAHKKVLGIEKKGLGNKTSHKLYSEKFLFFEPEDNDGGKLSEDVNVFRKVKEIARKSRENKEQHFKKYQNNVSDNVVETVSKEKSFNSEDKISEGTALENVADPTSKKRKMNDESMVNSRENRALKRHRSDLSVQSTESFKSEELDLENLEKESVPSRPTSSQNEESMDGLSQSSAALLNSQGDVYSTQYCVRRERASLMQEKSGVRKLSESDSETDLEMLDVCKTNLQTKGNKGIASKSVSPKRELAISPKMTCRQREKSSPESSSKSFIKSSDVIKNLIKDKESTQKPVPVTISGSDEYDSSKDNVTDKFASERTFSSSPKLDKSKKGHLDLKDRQYITPDSASGSSTMEILDEDPVAGSSRNTRHCVRKISAEDSSRIQIEDKSTCSSSEDEFDFNRQKIKTYAKRACVKPMKVHTKAPSPVQVPCPICFKEFAVSEIEDHASNCEGNSDGGNEAGDGGQQSSNGQHKDGRNSHLTGHHDDGDESEDKFLQLSSATLQETDKCFICDKVLPKGKKMETHVEMCIAKATKRQKLADTKGYNLSEDSEDEVRLELPRQTRSRASTRQQTEHRGQDQPMARSRVGRQDVGLGVVHNEERNRIHQEKREKPRLNMTGDRIFRAIEVEDDSIEEETHQIDG